MESITTLKQMDGLRAFEKTNTAHPTPTDPEPTRRRGAHFAAPHGGARLAPRGGVAGGGAAACVARRRGSGVGAPFGAELFF